jgi:hypothetical protein
MDALLSKAMRPFERLVSLDGWQTEYCQSSKSISTQLKTYITASCTVSSVRTFTDLKFFGHIVINRLKDPKK